MVHDDVVHQQPWENEREAPAERLRKRKAPRERLRKGKAQTEHLREKKAPTERLRRGKAQGAPLLQGKHTNGDGNKECCVSRYAARLLAMRPWTTIPSRYNEQRSPEID
jgi:hypothetical protein